MPPVEADSQQKKQNNLYQDKNLLTIFAVMSVNKTFFGLGQTLGPLLMGIAFGMGGISSVFYAGVGFASATLIVFRYCTCM